MPSDERLAQLLGDLHERERAGDRIDLDALAREHPDLADDLKAHFEALDLLDRSFEGDATDGDGLPDRLGDYRIEKELGRGGMGTVYLARDEKERKVALKVVHPHLLERRGFFKRFLREAEIGKRVRHENVVRTLDVDAVQIGQRTVHYLVMEYVEGRTLRALARDLGVVPEALLREVALQAACGLAAVHAAGIVHRDLKPENLLITDDHRVRIMDLGVARPIHESLALTQEGQFAGSLLYAAPEQFEQAEVTPAADLYALGVLLHELATGANPFHANEMAAVVKAHLENVPPRLNEADPRISAFFSELVATLLEKEPEKRIESAEALRDLLDQGERTTWWTEREREVIRARERIPVVPVRRETKLHGRETELELLRDAWTRARDGQGNTLLLQGEAGIGKSRLVDAFLRDGDGREAHVLYGSYPPSGGMGGISDAILGRFGAGDLDEKLRPYLTVTPSLVPGFAAILKHESSPAGGPPLEGDPLHAVWVQLMRALAAERPLLWVIEDLHFAAKENRMLALALARAVEGHRILLVLSTRPTLAEDELAHFSRLENFRRADLGRLSAREVILLLQDAFKSEALAEKLGGRIALKSDGVPFFVFEMIRGLKEGQFIEELPDGSYIESKVIERIEVPSAVKDLIEARLRGLAREDRAILDIGAVLGFEFDPDLVARVRELARVRVLEVLGDIERHSGVVRASGSRYRFDHHQIQEVIYADLSQGLREEYHTLVADAFGKRVEDERTGEDDAFLASHHLRGNRPNDGLPHLIPALVHLEESYRNDTALELATRALDTPNLLEGNERAEVLLKKAGRHSLRGERELERAALDEAVALADSSEDAARRAAVRVSRGWHLIQIADYAAARECLERALDASREAEDKKLEANATGNLGTVFLDQGLYEQARVQFEEWLALAREIGDRQGEARAIGSLGTVFLRQGLYELARAQIEESLALAREIGDRRSEAVALANLGGVFWHQGLHELARAQFEKRLALSREMGDRQGEATVTGNLGAGLFSQGFYEPARAQFEKSIALSREIGDRQGEARATGNLGNVFWSQGLCELARAQIERCLALSREIGTRSQEGYALFSLASLTEAEGDAEAALRLHRETLALRRELGEKGAVAATLVALGHVETEQGDHESAVEHLEEALTLAREVNDPGLILLATVHRSRLPGGDLDAALAALEEHEQRVHHGTKMEARFLLWETKDRAHLAEAKRLLDVLVGHTAEEYRTSMLENVPLHRDIMRAWEEQQGRG